MSALSADDIETVLQLGPETEPHRLQELTDRFQRWYKRTLNLPGTYYLQVVQCLYKKNLIANGGFMALGRAVNLSNVRVPVFMLAARDDELLAADQLFSARRLIGTPDSEIKTAVEPCGHLAVFLGARSLSGSWPRVAKWLFDDRCPSTEEERQRSRQGFNRPEVTRV